MKRYLIIAIGLLGILSADGFDIKGIINNVDSNAKTITLNNMLIQVMPQTQIKLDDCGIFGMDLDGKFVDLKVGSFAEVEAFPNQTNESPISYVASEIELKCVNNKAY